MGVMAQLGSAEWDLHEKIGKYAAEVADHVFTLNDAPYGNGTLSYDTSEEVVRECLKYADKDTVFLCKGSQIARVEKVVAGLLSSAVNPGGVLVRQEPEWV